MRHLFTIIITTVICLGVASCEPAHVRETIGHASSIMHDRPDSALTLMESIDSSEIHRDETRALHALYLTQARDKNHIVETDDSLINIALDYFDDEARPYEAMLAHFYRAQIHFNAKDYPTATTEALTALQLAKYDDHYNLAKIHELMADIHHRTFNISEALVHRRQAASYYRKANRKSNFLHSECEVAREYGGSGKYQDAINHLDSISYLYVDADNYLRELFHDSYIIPLAKLNRIDEAIKKHQLLMGIIDTSEYATYDFAYIAGLFVKINQPDSAYHYLDIAKNYNTDKLHKIKFHSAYYELYKHMGLPDSAIVHLEARHDIETETEMQEVASAERDFFNSLALSEQQKSKRYSLLFIVLCVSIIIAVGLYLVLNNIKVKKRRLKIQELICDYEDVRRQLISSKEKIVSLNNEIVKRESEIDILLKRQSMEDAPELVDRLLSKQFATLNRLFSQYFEKRTSETISTSFIKDFEEEISRLQHPESLHNIRRIVNDCRNNILLKLKEQIPSLKQTDIDFVALYLCGFNHKAICLILNINVGNYYNKRGRLRERIEKSNAPDKGFFLQYFA